MRLRPRTSRLPGVRVLLLVSACLLFVPIAAVARTNYQAATERVAAAEDAAAGASRLDTLLRLSTALSTEGNLTGATLGTAALDFDMPGAAIMSMNGVAESDLTEVRADVDALLELADEPELGASLRAFRDRVDSEDISVLALSDELELLTAELSRGIDEELAAVSASAVGAGSGESLIEALRTAERATAVQVVQTRQIVLWASIAAPFAEPTAAQTRQLTEAVLRFEAAASEFDSAVNAQSRAGQRWEDLYQSDLLASLQDEFEATVREQLVSGARAEPLDTIDVALTAEDFPQLAAGVREMIDVIALDEEVAARFESVTNVALEDLAAVAGSTEEAAVRSRTTVLLGLSSFGLVLVLGSLLLVRVIVKPIGHMARVAQALRDGQLDQSADEAGPKELSLAAVAMNEAIASLKLAEAQAVALAEERLDDPVLDCSAPGTLGSSLRQAVARLTESLTEREEFQRRLAHEASHDGLTKLPNRKAVLAHLESALARTSRSSTALALLFIDLDGFKNVNDTHGHLVGDTLLRATAQRLTGSARRGDLAGRLGGDEFVVVAEPVEGIDDAVALAERLLETLGEPVVADGRTILPKASIGVALATDDELTADELLRDADLAVYRAKELGRGRIEVCDEDLRGQVIERTTLEQALTAALVDGEFVLHFQPTIDARSSEITSLEALVRWDRPGHGLVPPDSFIPIAERSDLIIEVDRWVLAAVAAQQRAWRDHDRLGGLPIAVNISGRHFSGGRLVSDVTDVLERFGVDPHGLILEVTETALLEDLTSAARDLAKLRAMGIQIALDDFGTGYMSLSHLRNLPVDVLKIDRSFVAQLTTVTEHSLVELIVNTGHLLGVEVTAEGVETQEQVELLTELGSDRLQGFLFSRPLDAKTLEVQVGDVVGQPS